MSAITAANAAKMLGVSAGKVYALAAPAGPIPCTRIGKRIIFDQSDVLEYQASCRYIETKRAVASCSTSPARLKADESALQKSFRALGIKPRPTLLTGRNQPSSTPLPHASKALTT